MPTRLSNKSSLVLILFLTVLTYIPVLFNGFVGDDEVLFVRNDFYHSIENIKTLVSTDYLTDLSQYFGNNNGQYRGSGEWSYRPVRTASYFADAFLYKLNPFGYHLTNLLLHLGAVIFLYLSLQFILPSNFLVFLTTILFSLHPIQVEVVAGISYRTDSLATLFTLGALFFYLKHQFLITFDQPRRYNIFLALLFYVFGVLSKESVIVFPVIVFFYEIAVNQKSVIESFKKTFVFWIIAAVYLLIYFLVIKNVFIGQVPFSHSNADHRLITIAIIFIHYLKWLMFPLSVTLLPGLYQPPATLMLSPLNLLTCFMVCTCLFFLIKSRSHQMILFFGILWFLAAFLPVSNIIPLANPAAHRFMYFPSIGMFIVMACLFNILCQQKFIQEKTPNFQRLTAFIITALLMIQTLPMTFFWKSNFSIATQWVRHYPEFFKGHEILALEYKKVLECDKAIDHAASAITLNPDKDPRMFYVYGACLDDSDPDKSRYLNIAVQLMPTFSAAQYELGKWHYNKSDYLTAIVHFNNATSGQNHFSSSFYLIKTYVAIGEKSRAVKLFDELYVMQTNPDKRKYLENYFTEHLK